MQRKIFLLILFLFCLSGCFFDNQTMKYSIPKESMHNFVAGIEPEESSGKILVMVKGKGVEPETGTPIQKKIMAERAAVIDGYRKLAERLSGIMIFIQSKIGKNKLSMDQIMVEASVMLKGAQVNSISHHEGFATADVRVYIIPRSMSILY